MGKWGVAAAATGVGGTGAAGIYGAHHLGVFGGGKTGWSLESNAVQDEKTENVNKCLEQMFQGWKPNSNSLPSTSSISITPWELDTPTNACLVYNWRKEGKDKDYVGSKFHLVWTISKGKVGVAVDMTATVKSKEEMEFVGLSYAMKRENGAWKAMHRMDLRNGKLSKAEEWKAKFPKLEQVYLPKKNTPDYWGFLEGGGTKVKAMGEETSQQWWKWNNTKIDGHYQLKQWSSNFEIWWNHFFGKDRLDMMKLMEATKQGLWSD